MVCPLHGFIYNPEQESQETDCEGGGGLTWSQGPQVRLRPWAAAGEDAASVRGALTPPTESLRRPGSASILRDISFNQHHISLLL